MRKILFSLIRLLLVFTFISFTSYKVYGDEIESIDEFDPFLGTISKNLEEITIYANSHYVTPKPSLNRAIEKIRTELAERIKYYCIL